MPVSQGSPQAPRTAIGAREHPAGFSIAGYLLLRSIPADGPAEPCGDVSQMAHYRGAMSLFHVGIGALPALHTIQEIPCVRRVQIVALHLQRLHRWSLFLPGAHHLGGNLET